MSASTPGYFPFLDLPAEVQMMILGHIENKTDLHKLCQVSKEMKDISLPRLYRKISFFFAASPFPSIVTKQFADMLNEGNRGLQYIQRVKITLDRHSRNEEWPQQSQLVRELLMFYLPRNGVTEINVYDIKSGQKFQNLTLVELLDVCRKQRMLTILDIGRFSKDDTPEQSLRAADQILPYLRLVTKIRLKSCAHDAASIKLAVQLIAQNPAIAHLTIEADSHGLTQSAVGSLDFTKRFAKALKRHSTTRIPGTRLLENLATLMLDSLDLGCAGRCIAKAINAPCLKRLRISGCLHVQQLLGALSEQLHTVGRADLTRFEYISNEEVPSQQNRSTVASVDDFLLSFKGLENLFVINKTQHGTGRLQSSSILYHAESLVSLLLETDGCMTCRYPRETVREIRKNCLKLVNFGVTLPGLGFGEDLSVGVIGAYLGCIMDGPRLETLSLACWPDAEEFQLVLGEPTGLEDIDEIDETGFGLMGLFDKVACDFVSRIFNRLARLDNQSSSGEASLLPKVISLGAHHDADTLFIMGIQCIYEQKCYEPVKIEEEPGLARYVANEVELYEIREQLQDAEMLEWRSTIDFWD